MQILIDISDMDYNDTKKYGTILDECRDDIAKAIINGKLIPKGHGRLIDEDVLLRNAKSIQTVIDVNNAPTIIEAVAGGK